MDLDINGLMIIFAVASIVAILAKMIRWPYTITLVIAGIVVAVLGLKAPFELSRDLIFHILLPPLLFEGALHMRLSHLRKNAKVIGLLVLPGMMISVFLVGSVLGLLMGLPIIIALLIAAIVIPTDPASILAFYKEMKVPKRLRSIVEGESVFDDGLAIVLFNVLVVVILASSVAGGVINVSQEQVWGAVGEFFKLSFLGIMLGVVLGYVTFLIIQRIDDKFTEIMITVILAFGIFAIAEALGGSGVFAVVISGLILGNYGTRFAMAPSTRMSLLNFWTFLAFAVNSFLFILVGMNVSLSAIAHELPLIALTITLLLLARAAMIFVIGKIVNREKTELPGKWQVTMWWGGLRGAIPIALALSIPEFIFYDAANPANNILFPYRDTILAATFGVVLITLIMQGLTLRPVLRKLGFYGLPKKEAEKEEKEIAALLKDTMNELGSLLDDGELDKPAHDWLITRFGQINSLLITELGMLIRDHGFIPKEEYSYAVREALQAKKDAVKDAWERNLIPGATGEKLMFELDEQLSILSSEHVEDTPRTPVEILKSVTRAESSPIENNCGMCMTPVEVNESSYRCRCGTVFHEKCLENVERCPICIAELPKLPKDQSLEYL